MRRLYRLLLWILQLLAPRRRDDEQAQQSALRLTDDWYAQPRYYADVDFVEWETQMSEDQE